MHQNLVSEEFVNQYNGIIYMYVYIHYPCMFLCDQEKT